MSQQEVTRRTVDIDDHLLAEATEILGTRTIKETVHEALSEILRAELRRRHVRRLSTMEGLDLDNLADKSALARIRIPPVGERMDRLIGDALVATCAIIDPEVLYRARNLAEIPDNSYGTTRVGRCTHHPPCHKPGAGRAAPTGPYRTPPLGHRGSDHRRHRRVVRSDGPALRHRFRTHRSGHRSAARMGCPARFPMRLHRTAASEGRSYRRGEARSMAGLPDTVDPG